jgi:hypothetical protein
MRFIYISCRNYKYAILISTTLRKNYLGEYQKTVNFYLLIELRYYEVKMLVKQISN